MEDKHVSKSYTDTFCSKTVLIAISGIIGAGKTTLTQSVGKEFKADVLFEPVEKNEYLTKFYKDMKKYSFPMQIYLLNHRFQQHQKMVWSGKNTIQDRSIYEDVIFAKMLHEDNLMEELDFNTYIHLYSNMSNFLHRPDLIVYLDVEPEEALRRIKMRNRECETNLPIDYLRSLKKGYEDWLQDIEPRIPVLRIDWNTFKSIDYVTDLIHKKLKKTKKGLVI